MTIRNAIKMLGHKPEDVYKEKVLDIEIPPGYVPLRVGFPHNQDKYMGVGSGNLYANTTGATYYYTRLIVGPTKFDRFILED